MQTATKTHEVTLNDLERGLTVRYGKDGQVFTIPRREVENFVLQQFIKMRQQQSTASLN